jgi:hypothetical protein
MLICEVVKLVELFPSGLLGKNDMFVLVECNGKLYRTKTVWDNNNPEWDSTFIFKDEISYEEVEIKVSLNDEDTWSRNETLREGIIKTKNGIFFGECCGIILKCYSVEMIQLGEKDLLQRENKSLIEENADLKERASYIKRELGFFIKSLK